MSHGALASLTATYTDSEGEEDVNEEENDSGTSPPSNIPSVINSTPASPIALGQVRQLVSYHDDTVISDDENIMQDLETDSEVIQTTPEPEPVTDDGIRLPPEPRGKCTIELQDKIQQLHDQVAKGFDMNLIIQKKKDFRNPSIYEKLIQFCGISELGTNYPPEIYDPLRWRKESFYEELAKEQKKDMERREKERKEKTKVEFVSGTRRPGSGAEEDSKRRKSKWDQPAANASGAPSVKPAGLVQPTLTTAATGTKGTVISALGPFTKKPRLQ